MNNGFEGVVVPLLTPLKENEDIDCAALRKLVYHVVGGGVHGLFFLGTTGEFSRLTEDQRLVVAQAGVAMVNRRLPVYLGVSDSGTRRVVNNLRHAERIGVDVAVCSLPYYFRLTDCDEQVRFFESIVGNTDLPVMLYNMPSATGAEIQLPVVRKLMEKANVIGIKDSSGSVEYISSLLALERREGFKILAGSESLSKYALMKGAHGLVPSLANIFPRLFVELYEACLKENEDIATAMQDKVNELNKLNSFCHGSLGSIVWRKKALSYLGISSDYVTEPSLELKDRFKAEIREALEKEGVSLSG